MGVRIAVVPLLIGVDGSILPKEAFDYAQYVIDPMRFSPEGLKEAARYARPESLGIEFSTIKKDPENEASFTKQIFKTPEGKDFIRGIFADRDHAQRETTRFANAHIRDIIDHPEEAFERLKQARQKAHSEDEAMFTRSFRPTLSPELLKPILNRIMDTGYAESADFAAESKQINDTLRQALKRQPDYLQILAGDDNMTIAVMKEIVTRGHICNGISIQRSGLIALNANIVMGNPAELDQMLREELIHYFDTKQQFSLRPDYQAAADALLQDPERMRQIDKISTTAMPGKAAVSKYRENHAMELLPNYFLIRDHLRELNNKSGCAFGGLIRSKKKKEANVDADMEKIFGKEFHQLCQQFEQSLQEQAKALPAIRPQ